MGNRSRSSAIILRRLVAPLARHPGHKRMGLARYIRKRPRTGGPAWREIRAQAALLGPAYTQASTGGRFRRGEPAGVRAASGARSDQGIRLRQLGDQPERFI